MKVKDIEVGQELYDFYINDNNNKVSMTKVYVIEKNKASFYFSYSKYDRTNSFMRLKLTGSFPKSWMPSIIEFHYISDDEEFGERWLKTIKERKHYKDKIDHAINEAYVRNNVSELKLISEALEDCYNKSEK